MDAKLKDMAEYIVIAIHEFAKRHQLEEKQAYRYLNHYKAIDFLENQYDVAHTQRFDDIIEGLTALCQRHGGALV